MSSTTIEVQSRDGLALDAATLCEAFRRTSARYAERPALRRHGGSQEFTWAAYAESMQAVAAGLAELGLQAGETLGLLLLNSPEMVIVDCAAMHLGAVPFSIYNTSSPEQIEYLLTHARCRVLVSERRFAESIESIAGRVAGLEHVVYVDGREEDRERRPSRLTLAGLRELGRPDFDLEARWRAVAPQDVATLIYTSGTTGPPKAVELTHENLLWEMRLLDRVLPLRPGGRCVSYLPMAHLAERWNSHYSPIVSGTCATFVEDIAEVIPAVASVHPTAWGGVPRVWEKLKSALEAGFAAEPDARRREAVGAAIEEALRCVRCEQRGEELPDSARQRRAEADGAIFAPLRARLGFDESDHLISGAAPIAEEVLEFFAAIGLGICEIWGMTETSLIATANPPEAIRIGTVGRALPGIELTLAADGELLVRGPTVMRGYRDDPQRTAEAIDDEGWLHTGDVAEIDGDGYVRIVDRKKELIINAGGKNMSPANIENRIKAACQLVGSAVAIGDRRPYNTALIVLDPVATQAFATANGIVCPDGATLDRDPVIRGEVAAGVERANAALSRIEQIKQHTIIAGEWLPGGEELTPTMKLRRRPIAEKYAGEIDAMYDGG